MAEGGSPSSSSRPASTSTQTFEEGVSEENYDEEHVQECLDAAEELKQEGNDFFREKKWDHALTSYRTGLNRLPKRRESGKGTGSSPSGEDIRANDAEGDGTPSKDEESSENPGTELDQRCAKSRAVMNANIGACYVKLDDYKEAVKACTQALLDDPHYIKALQRRAASNDKLNSWSSLTSAQEDYTTLLSLLPQDSPQTHEINRTLHFLKPRVEAAQKQETGEMLDKLKGLGNSILGNFGLSTDNFKFEPNGQGGYSMNFAR